MSFFVPYMPDREGSELLWDHGREQLEDRGLPTTWRRIRALLLEHRGVTLLVAAVGSDTEVEEDDPVMLILEASDVEGLVYVYTLSQLVEDRRPFGLRLDVRWRVVDFGEGAGQA
ncbi:MAG: hypothetical protein QOD42_3396 [Sphingomonadales bacterium]|jgi:hypothetical protein|nr:hypothetical protein [Sphingomonadales bacterium]